jgi:transcriptional regulator with XRE-family HTH domain
MDDYRVANRIRAFRKLKGYTQSQFADKLGVSLAVLGDIERGTRKPSQHMLMAITKALGVSVEELTLNGQNEVNESC